MRTTTTRRTSVRRAAAATGLVVLGGLLPALAVAAPAQAADVCPSEAPTGLPAPLDQRCDDVDPPLMSALAMQPNPNAAGWIRTGRPVFTFTGGHAADSGDTDAVFFQCRLDGPGKQAQWQECSSPWQLPAGDVLADDAQPYTFSTRVVDAGDHDQAPLQGRNGDGQLYTAGLLYDAEAAPDYSSARSVSFKIDTRAPVGLLFGAPVDVFTPDDPVLASQALTVTLRANETAADFSCLLDDRSVPCSAGRNTFGGLRPGAHTLRASLVDPAGNVGSGDLETAFWSAHDLRGTRAQRARWQVRRDPAAVGGSYLESTTRGALLTLPARRVKEVRLIARTGPGAGKVRVRVGRARWTTYDLASTADEAQDLAQFQVRGPFRSRTTGTVQVQVVSSGRPVRVDGLVLR